MASPNDFNDNAAFSFAALGRELDEDFSLVTTGDSSSRRSLVGESSPRPPALSLPTSTTSAGGGSGNGLADDLVCVLVTAVTKSAMCCGFVGQNNQRFCLAAVDSGGLTCGLKAHASSKYVPLEDCFYAPGGSNHGKQTAFCNVWIEHSQVPDELVTEITTGTKTSKEWVQFIRDIESALASEVQTPRVDATKEEVKGTTFDSSKFECTVPKVVFANSVEGNEFESKSWAPHVGDLMDMVEQLGTSLRVANDNIPQVGQELHDTWSSALAAIMCDLKDLKERQDATQKLIGNAERLAQKYGTISVAVEGSVESVTLLSEFKDNALRDISRLSEEAASAADGMKRLERSTLESLAKLSRNNVARNKKIEVRLDALERGSGLKNSARTPTGAFFDDLRDNVDPRVAGSRGMLSLDTSFGGAGTGREPVTMGLVMNRLRTIEAKQDIAMERSKQEGLTFDRHAFASQVEWTHCFVNGNPKGAGIACFVDIMSIWSHTNTGDATTEYWLQQTQRAMSTGINSKLASDFIATFQRRYPAALVGNTMDITPGTTLSAFKTRDKWTGTGLADGRREHLMGYLRLGIERHRTYVRDNLPPGDLRDIALKTGELTLDWYNAFFVHLDEEATMLISLGISEDNVMNLLSSQTLHVYDEIFEIRQHAMEYDPEFKLQVASRMGWIALRAHGVMKAYMDMKFKFHPAINSTYVRFLTKQTGQNSAAGLGTKLTSMDNKIKKLDSSLSADIDNVKKAITKADTKIEAVIKANTLKRS